LLASAARTNSAVAVSAIQDGIPAAYRGVLIVVDVTVDGAASTGFVVDVDNDDGTGFATALASATINSVGTTLMLVHPSAPTDRANTVEKTPLLYKWRVTWTHSDANAMTGSVSAFYLI
jgi:hypothetical protein